MNDEKIKIKELVPNNIEFTFKDMFGKDIAEQYYEELDIKYVQI